MGGGGRGGEALEKHRTPVGADRDEDRKSVNDDEIQGWIRDCEVLQHFAKNELLLANSNLLVLLISF